MRRIALLFVLLATAAGCKPGGTEPKRADLPDLRGEWSYVATQMRLAGFPSEDECRIDGMTLLLGEWQATGLTGRSSGGEMRCTGELSHFSASLPSYPIREGGFVSVYFSFSLGGSDWRHEGEISHDTVKTVVGNDTTRRVVFTDTIRGNCRLRSGGTEFHGKYRAVRRSRSN